MMSETTERAALLGGRPACPKGPPPWPAADPAITEAVRIMCERGSWGYHAPQTEELSTLLCQFHRVRHALLCASGTLAVELALRAIGVKVGDEVILAGYDYEPSFLTIHALGARPVLIDVEPGGITPNLDQLSDAIGTSVRAVLVSHLHGALVPMPAVRELADRQGIAVIEDAAQAVGAVVAGRLAGSWGDIGILSFGGSKLLTAGRGGALLTDRDDLAQRLRLLMRRGIQEWAPLSSWQAAVLLPQVARLQADTIARGQAVYELVERLRPIPGVTPSFSQIHGSPAFYKVGFRYSESTFGLSRHRWVEAMRAEGVAFDEGFRAIPAGRSSTRYRTVGPLSESLRAGSEIVTLHHPVLRAGSTALAEVATALGKTYRDREQLAGLGPATSPLPTSEGIGPQ